MFEFLELATQEVAQTPKAVIGGGDPQLEAAVAVALAELDASPPPPAHAKAPRDPDRSRL